MSVSRRTIAGWLLTLALFGAGIAVGLPVHAQEDTGMMTNLESFGEDTGLATDTDVVTIIARLIRVGLSFLGILALCIVLWGGFKYMTSGGVEDKVKGAKKLMTSGLIGLVIILSAYTITSFIFSALGTALGTTETSGGNSSDDYCDGACSSGSSALFEVDAVNMECAEAIQNFQPQMTFTKSVSSASVTAGGITLVNGSGTAVAGSFDVSGKRVTFTPDEVCVDEPDEYCFDAGGTFTLTFDNSILESTSGTALTCNSDCVYEFTVGTTVDAEAPSSMVMDAPDDGQPVYENSIELLQTIATDDSGVSSVDFTVDSDTVFQASLTNSSEGVLSLVNTFATDSTQWDTLGYDTGTYSIRAEGYDCAGHSTTSSAVDVVIYPAHCGNTVMDEDETDIDCGGEDCGACDGSECDSNDDCSSGYCEIDADTGLGTCVGVPKITSVSPGDGAVGNLITVAGTGFGAVDAAGTITFVGDEDDVGDDVSISAYECNGAVQWSDEEIIIQVTDAMTEGAVKVTTSTGYSDATNDDYGPTIADFDINLVVRPGICLLEPSTGLATSSTTISGNNFGDSQGSSTVYFDSYEAEEYSGSWDDTSISDVVIPVINARDYDTQVWAGDYVCQTSEGAATTTSCTADSDCTADDAGATCATGSCAETGELCVEDDDCGETGGVCESLRHGSNKVEFTVTDDTDGTVPVISQIDTGWTACSGGFDAGARCAEDTDCESSCEDAGNWGPPEQYVTITGSNFGSSTGFVRFTTSASAVGTDALGDTSFPDACGDDQWDDDQIIVKVPSEFTNEATIEAGTYTLTVERVSDGVSSDGAEFVILDDEAGPSICELDPNAGPEEITVAITGENFESAQGDGYVTFMSTEVDTYNSWGNLADDGSQVSVDVPVGAESGSVVLISDTGYSSNSVNFEVGNCADEAADFCGDGRECCADGSCAVAGYCDTPTTVSSHYAWKFSTGPLPTTPSVLVQCDEDYISPSPWSGWNSPDEVCMNAVVTASFSTLMDASSYSGNVTVESCGGVAEAICTADAECSSGDCDIAESETTGTCIGVADSVCSDEEQLVAVEGSIVSGTERTLQWQPSASGRFSASTIYLVTVHATGGEYSGVLSSGLETMDADYSWIFVTADSTDLCEVEDVFLSPPSYTADEEGQYIDYSAYPVANECVVLACSTDGGYDWEWGTTDDENAPLGGEISGSYGCQNSVTTLGETEVGSPAEISAEITDVSNTPSDTGELTINYLDPEVSSYTPACETACINADVFAEFNIAMDNTTLGTDFEIGDTVWLYACEDALCDDGEITEVEDLAAPIDYTLQYVDTDENHRLTLSLGADDDFEISTYYRVRISGDVVSLSGVPLSQSGTNYGSENNRVFEDDFSWIFRTKDDATICAIDRIDVSPSEANAERVGETKAFIATAYGEPDECSSSGQALDENDYTWQPWTAADSPNLDIDASVVVASMLEDGSILQSTSLANNCSSSCLNTGSSVTDGDSICGDGITDYDGNGENEAEDCDDGNTVSGDGCSSNCLLEGQSACEYVCYANGSRSDENELTTTCEGADDTSSCDGAADDGTDATCFSTVATCCGDGTVDDSEECDDGDSDNGDGCSSTCLNEGDSDTCGNGSVDYSARLGGEDCDDGNDDSGDGCSSTCRFEGSVEEEDVYSTCGNGGDPEAGEDCDDGNIVDGDGCSSECLNEGTDECVYECFTSGGARVGDSCSGLSDTTCSDDETSSADDDYSCEEVVSTCCGDGVEGTGEDCDDGNDDDGDGCSSECLYEGAGLYDDFTAICGDGDTEYYTEEAVPELRVAEECEATTAGSVGGYGVALVEDTAVFEVSETTNTAGSTITATAGDPAVPGEATLTLTCACTDDLSCAETTADLALYGCGTSNCCFDRPSVVQAYPVDAQDDVCLNTAIWVDFSTDMDETTFNPDSGANLFLELLNTPNSESGSLEAVTETNCPTSYTDATVSLTRAEVPAPTNIFSRAWRWVSSTVRGWFGSSAVAARYACLTPVTYTADSTDSGTGSRIRLLLSDALEADSDYQLVVIGDADLRDDSNDGVLSNGVGINDDETIYEFTTGDEICTVDIVTVEDLGRTAYVDGSDPLEEQSSEYYTSTSEEHILQATAYTIQGSSQEEIIGIDGVYSWSWEWNSEEADDATNTENIVTMDVASTTTTAAATSTGVIGEETAYATAVTNDYDDSTVTDPEVEGEVILVANTCENPWPTVADFPYIDTASHFSFYYCRDAGEEGDTTDDLPALDTEISVDSYSSTDVNIIQELIFPVVQDEGNDAVGVRVIQNSDFLPPDMWYEEQGFIGAPSETEVDGYEGIQDGNTTYVVAANQPVASSSIYSNVYILSYNEDATDESQEVFEQILANWSFNAYDPDVTPLISDNNNCMVDDNYVSDSDGDYVECGWNGDCLETCVESVCSLTGEVCVVDSDCALASTEGPLCSAEKGMLTRDMRRLTDIVRIKSALDTYGEANGHCAVTTEQSCDEDDDCPGTEACEPGVPTLASGTLVRAMAVSPWSSWVSELDNAVGETLPVDPVNEFYDCSESGYDSTTCWEPVSSTFTCPDGSHVYGYAANGIEGYDLYAQLEYKGGAWEDPIDANASDSYEIYVQQDYVGAVQDGFIRTASLCGDGQCSTTTSRSCISDATCPDGQTCKGSDADWGNSDRCGDGIQGTGEYCEIGDTDVVDCASIDGTIAVPCNDSCTGYMSASDAESATYGGVCSEYECGNGVTETDIGEECDDGDLNGTYGYCGNGCLLTTAFGCGDGYLAGGESCDCGTVSNFSSLTSDSWAVINGCSDSNGQYVDAIDVSCAFDCTSPGPSCGDAEVNGGEQCDGDYETWSGSLCDGSTESDYGETCTSNSDCDSGTCGGSTSTNACTSGRVCEDADGATDAGEVCSADTECDSGVCSLNTYSLTRARTCSGTCEWNSLSTPGGWTECMVLDGTCGNGTTDGDEECDDGNDDSTDACTNTCELNVCGDDFVYSGVESCDDGSGNGDTCDATYGGVCYYCTETCQYKSRSGAYCGDEEINGSEFCDGSDVPYYLDLTDGEISLYGTCDPDDIDTGTVTANGKTYTCRSVGACNGGDENGDTCTPDVSSGSDYNDCTGGTCVSPTCSADCSSTCPVTYSSVAVTAQTEEVGASPESSITLYKYNQGDSPDNGALFIPACSVATSLTAQVDTANVELPQIAVVFVTDLSSSMASVTSEGSSSDRRIDLVVDETQDAVDRLFDAYAGTDLLQVGLVSLSSQYHETSQTMDTDGLDVDGDGDCEDTDEYYCGVAGSTRDGANIDLALTDDENEVLAVVENYSSCVYSGDSECGIEYASGSNPNWSGIDVAMDMLEAATADEKILVLLSDGDMRWDASFNGTDYTDYCDCVAQALDADARGDIPFCEENSSTSDDTHQTSFRYTNGGVSMLGDDGCVAESKNRLMVSQSTGSASGVIVYTAAVQRETGVASISNMAHLSNEECDWTITQEDDRSSSDDWNSACASGTYAFAGDSAEDIEDMYDAIIDSILGVRLNYIYSLDGSSVSSTAAVNEGQYVSVPLPESFSCETEEQTVPLTFEFYGSGAVTLSDIQLNYCPN